MNFRINEVERSRILEMLKTEQQIRYSKQIQDIYTELYIHSIHPDVSVESAVQRIVLRKYGYDNSPESLKEYWKIPSTYWKDEEVKNSIFYMKLNIFQNSPLKLGDDIIDADLINYKTGNKVNLCSLQKIDRPLILLAGSLT